MNRHLKVGLVAGFIVGIALAWVGTQYISDADHIPSSAARFKVTCGLSHTQADDPIVYPNQPGVSHLHEFFGNRDTTPEQGTGPEANAYTTTYAQLQANTTTCNDAQDKAGYWSPKLQTTSGPRAAKRITAYYRRGNKHGTIEAYPDGLKIVAGWQDGQPQPPADIANWHCGHQKFLAPTGTCNETGGWSMQIRFPDCWDGVNTDSADHRSHMAYSSHDATAEANVCPVTHPVPVPELEVNVNYEPDITNGATILGTSAGGLETIHADFFQGWVRARLLERIETCLNQIQVCASGG